MSVKSVYVHTCSGGTGAGVAGWELTFRRAQKSHREDGFKITILKRRSVTHFKVSVRFTRSESGAFLRAKVGKRQTRPR